MRTNLLRALASAAFVLGACTAAPAQSPAPSPSPDALMAPVRALVAAFNAAGAYPAQLFTADAVVTDEFPPFVWNAVNGGAKQWWRDLVGDANSAQRERFVAAKQHVETGAPEFVRVAGDGAWFVCPATLQYTTRAGVKHVQQGRWLFYLRREGDVWRISAHAWDELSDVTAA